MNIDLAKPDPNVYVVLDSSNQTFRFGIMNYPLESKDYLIKDYIEAIELYMKKYDINNYNGEITIFQQNNIISLLYKNKVLGNHIESDVNFCFPDILYVHKVVTDILLKLQRIDNHEMSRLSFDIKIKGLMKKLQDFYKYLILDPKKTNLWLNKNIVGRNE